MTDRYKSRASTHADDCWSWGHGHYECAVREIKALRAEVAEWKRVASAQAELHDESESRAERLAMALRRYGVHDQACSAMDIPICTCGLDAALEQEDSND